MTSVSARVPEIEAAVLAEACLRAIEGEGPPQASKYYRARYYDPRLGRFISEDPVRFAGGVNFYRYVGDRPVSYRDPFGLITWKEAQAKGWSRGKYLEHLKNLEDAIDSADLEMVAAVLVSMKAVGAAAEALACPSNKDSDRTLTLPPRGADRSDDLDLYFNKIWNDQLRARGGDTGNFPGGRGPTDRTEADANTDDFLNSVDRIFKQMTGREPPLLW
jgi:uncharacterized protein RhaS with RHS repeats